MPFVKAKRSARRMPSSRVKSIVKAEVKKQAETKAQLTFQTETSFGTTLTSPNNWYSLNNIVKGVQSHDRVGNKISPTYVDVRGCLKANANVQMYHKVMILSQNKQSDPLLDLLEDNNGAYNPATEDLGAIYARVNTAKYTVLASRVLKTGTSNGGNSEELTKMFHMKMPLRGVVEYQEDESIAQKKRITIICFSRRADNDVTLGDAVEWTFNAKYYYKDM